MNELPADYNFHLDNAEAFLDCADYWIKKERYHMACINLHQAVVQGIVGVMIGFIGTKHKTHDLYSLLREMDSYDHELTSVFCQKKEYSNHLVDIL